jgi:hypothetical protein
MCGRKVLQEYGVESEANAMKVLLRHENQENTLAKYSVILNAVKAGMVSPKARTMRYRLEVVVRSTADKQDGDEVAPELVHATKVDLVHQAFDDQAPAIARQHPIIGLFNAARTTLGLQFTAFFVVPIGELQIDRKDRAFYDGWAYLITCAEHVST